VVLKEGRENFGPVAPARPDLDHGRLRREAKERELIKRMTNLVPRDELCASRWIADSGVERQLGGVRWLEGARAQGGRRREHEGRRRGDGGETARFPVLLEHAISRKTEASSNNAASGWASSATGHIRIWQLRVSLLGAGPNCGRRLLYATIDEPPAVEPQSPAKPTLAPSFSLDVVHEHPIVGGRSRAHFGKRGVIEHACNSIARFNHDEAN
jgi:hypothetical protein